MPRRSPSSGVVRCPRDILVALTILALVGCGGLTRRAIRSAPPEENLEHLRHEHSWVREDAALALGAARVVDAVGPLEALVVLREEDPYVRAAAARALGAIGAPSSLGVLTGIAAERGASPTLQLAVVEAVCRYQADQPSAVQALAPLAQHQDLLVAAAAKKGIQSGCAK